MNTPDIATTVVADIAPSVFEKAIAAGQTAIARNPTLALIVGGVTIGVAGVPLAYMGAKALRKTAITAYRGVIAKMPPFPRRRRNAPAPTASGGPVIFGEAQEV